MDGHKKHSSARVCVCYNSEPTRSQARIEISLATHALYRARCKETYIARWGLGSTHPPSVGIAERGWGEACLPKSQKSQCLLRRVVGILGRGMNALNVTIDERLPMAGRSESSDVRLLILTSNCHSTTPTKSVFGNELRLSSETACSMGVCLTRCADGRSIQGSPWGDCTKETSTQRRGRAGLLRRSPPPTHTPTKKHLVLAASHGKLALDLLLTIYSD